MFVHCRNSKCVNYYEDGCMRDLNGKMVVLNEDGQCEDYKAGVNDAYREGCAEKKICNDCKYFSTRCDDEPCCSCGNDLEKWEDNNNDNEKS